MTTPLIPGQALFGPLIFGTPITTATQDRPYTGFTVTTIGGLAPLTFGVASGALPDGISINASTGVVSGTPTAADVYAAIVLSVTGANGVSADLDAFTITVAEPVQIAGTPVTTAIEGEPYDGFTVTGTEGTAPLVYAVHTGVFPDGIDIDPDTGEVAGTPTESGAFVGIVLDVTDTYGSTADLPSFDLTVSPPPPPPPGPPVWLPQAPSGDYPLVYADFKNGHYWGNAAETVLTTLFVSGPFGTFDPTTVVSGHGLTSAANDAVPMTDTPFGTDFSGGVTAVFTLTELNVTSAMNMTVDLIDIDDANDFGAFGTLAAGVLSTNVQRNVSGPVALGPTTAATIKTAFTVTAAKTVGSVNGGMATADTSTVTPSVPLTNVAVQAGFATQAYMSDVAIYAPQPNTDLPTLSGA